MPVYNKSAFSNAKLLQKGVPIYLLGTYDYKRGNTNMYLTNTALTSNVATYTVQVLNGPAPQVGDILSVINSTNGSGVFNIASSPITATTINNSTGAGTLTVALTNANIGTAADSGSVISEPWPVGDAIAAGNSIACCVQAPEGDSQFTLPVAVTFDTIPTAVTVTLQVAIVDIDAEYTNTASVITVAGSAYTKGPVIEATLERGYFYRLAVSGLTGGSKIIGKIG